MRVLASSISVGLVTLAAACGPPDPDESTNSGGATGTLTSTNTSGTSASSGATSGTTTGPTGPSTTGAVGSGGSTGADADGATATTTGTGGTNSMTSTAGVAEDTTASGGVSTSGSEGSTLTSGMGGNSSTASATTTGGMADCASGPLDVPLPNCSPEPVPDTGDYYADCVARINQFRWECQCLPPLERWTEGESCADQHAEYDYEQDTAHAGIRAGICSPGDAAQNECPGYGPNFGIVDFCLQQMWDEGPGEDFQAHGHYLNMSNPDFSRVACGMYVTPDGDVWAVQNFQ